MKARQSVLFVCLLALVISGAVTYSAAQPVPAPPSAGGMAGPPSGAPGGTAAPAVPAPPNPPPPGNSPAPKAGGPPGAGASAPSNPPPPDNSLWIAGIIFAAILGCIAGIIFNLGVQGGQWISWTELRTKCDEIFHKIEVEKQGVEKDKKQAIQKAENNIADLRGRLDKLQNQLADYSSALARFQEEDRAVLSELAQLLACAGQLKPLLRAWIESSGAAEADRDKAWKSLEDRISAMEDAALLVIAPGENAAQDLRQLRRAVAEAAAIAQAFQQAHG